MWHQCQLVQDPLSLELNRRLVVKSRLSEIFSDVNASVEPPHFFVISSNLTTINTRTIGFVLTLHRHFHLSPLDPLARKREGSAEGATCSVAQSKRGGPKTGTHLLFILAQLPQCRAGNRLKIRVPSIFQSLFGWFLSQVFTGRMISVGTPSALYRTLWSGSGVALRRIRRTPFWPVGRTIVAIW